MADNNTTITWRGRKMLIRTPGGAQLATWNRVAKQAAEVGSGEGELTEEEKEERQTLLDRLLRIIMSLFHDQADKDWLYDQLLDGEITDADVLEIFTQATEGIADAHKTKGPAKKAARRT